MNKSLAIATPGRNYVRGLIARTLTNSTDADAIHAFARTRWGEGLAADVTKAAVSAMGTVDTGLDAREFFGLARDESVLGRMEGLRRVPFVTRMLAVQAGARGYWVSQGKSKPLSRATLAGSSLDPLKVAAIIVTTKEMLLANEPGLEATLQDDLLRAVTVVMDEALLDPDNAGVAGEVPASIAFGATQLSATTDFGADLKAMIQAFRGDLASAYFVTDPATATGIATMTDAGGRYLFPGIGPRGGELLGIPVLTSRADTASTSGSTLTLIDPTGIAAALGAFSVDSAGEVTLQMSDDPNDAGSPVLPVSMWQTNSVAMRVELAANWSRQRPGAVVVLEGL
ncbi:phage major capsid protein [Hydrogenophaga sp. BPS33]|uniref:phage major capsid protein n=1 Tax=Hydrogenophaga sp. BPS33 TaxID=2651974 RepID=UPI00132011C0|nr:phage major capsid protein [Hydrogenophaga sp. BPS33]QHE86516.1 phage major capsid protein [Hydrogenophaga sp. BPS33]